jgi:uncharacterized protein (DUF1697 family)
MESLCAMHERLGHRNVQIYIQSGNIVLSANGTADAIAKNTATEFAKEFGFTPKIVVIDAKRWSALVDDNPYANFATKDPKTVHAAICDGEPNASGLKTLLAKTGGSETFVITAEGVYLHFPDGFGTSKFAVGMEKAAGVPMTVRNWRTIEALKKMTSV